MMMRGVIFVVYLVFLLTSAFAIPSGPPFDIEGFGNSDIQTEQESSSIENQSNSVLPPEPLVPNAFDLDSNEPAAVPTRSPGNPSFTQTSNSNTSPNSIWMIGIFIFLVLNFILLSIILVMVFRHMFKKDVLVKHQQTENTNVPPSFESKPTASFYTETFEKLEHYIKQYMGSYSYKQIKTALVEQGFTEEEIESVYLEVRKHVR